MSCKTKIAYIKLFREVVKLLRPHKEMRVRRICLDFEAATWGALRVVLPTVKLQGCGFHFYQAIFRKIQKLGLATMYTTNKQFQHTCRQLMTLNLLPHRFIRETFNTLKSKNKAALDRPLFQYFEKNWLNSSVWGPKTGLPDETTPSDDDSKVTPFLEFAVLLSFNILSSFLFFLFFLPPFLSPDSIKNFCIAILNWLRSNLSLCLETSS